MGTRGYLQLFSLVTSKRKRRQRRRIRLDPPSLSAALMPSLSNLLKKGKSRKDGKEEPGTAHTSISTITSGSPLTGVNSAGSKPPNEALSPQISRQMQDHHMDEGPEQTQPQAQASNPHNQSSVPSRTPEISNLMNPAVPGQQQPGQQQGTNGTVGEAGAKNVPIIDGAAAAQGTGTLPQYAAAAAPTQQRSTKGKYSVADFEFKRTLGTGSFGRVHLARSVHNNRFYAIKALEKEKVVKMKQIEHTNDERSMLAKVKHPFLITLWGTFQDSRSLFMVMDFIEGGELFSLLRKSQVRL